MDPLRRLANTVGRDSKLSTRGTLIDGELRSAQGPSSAPPVWFVFTGDLLLSACVSGSLQCIQQQPSHQKATHVRMTCMSRQHIAVRLVRSVA